MRPAPKPTPDAWTWHCSCGYAEVWPWPTAPTDDRVDCPECKEAIWLPRYFALWGESWAMVVWAASAWEEAHFMHEMYEAKGIREDVIVPRSYVRREIECWFLDPDEYLSRLNSKAS